MSKINELYDIGTEIICKTCFGHNSAYIEALVTYNTSISRRDLQSGSVKTQFNKLNYIVFNVLMSKIDMSMSKPFSFSKR